ncbi:MAG TPA: DUF3102 domain-containing protein [Burkholderiales bacterium]|nr:DUF3102 domain-containing protein [Burkholderiales bacterium]
MHDPRADQALRNLSRLACCSLALRRGCAFLAGGGAMIGRPDAEHAAAGSNRLPALATEIREAHAGVFSAAKTAAERAIEAGQALIEAKALVKHGQWGNWLRDHCALPERTAQLYMQIARSGFNSATVADMGLRATAKLKVWATIATPDYNPFAHCDEDGKRDWQVFVLFLVRSSGFTVDGAAGHTEWILQRQFATPAEWLGDEGEQSRGRWGMRSPSRSFKRAFTKFLGEFAGHSAEDVEALLSAESKQAPAAPQELRR